MHGTDGVYGLPVLGTDPPVLGTDIGCVVPSLDTDVVCMVFGYLLPTLYQTIGCGEYIENISGKVLCDVLVLASGMVLCGVLYCPSI
eukprot:1996639-Rhodomonas_salina.3